LGISRTIIPAGPGHFSAFGMLTGPLRGEAVRTVVGPLSGTSLAAAFAPAERSARAELAQSADGAVIARYAELRYRGQEHTLEVPAREAVLGGAGRESQARRDAFERRCLQTSSFRLDAPLEIVSVRVTATAPVSGEMRWGETGPADGHAAPAHRTAFRLV